MAEVKPITLQYEDGTTYTLEFSAQTVADGERAGLIISQIMDKPVTLVPLLFFFAFKMHHPSISKKKTDSILFDDLGGLSQAMQERLIELYLAPVNELGNEGGTKNPTMKVEM